MKKLFSLLLALLLVAGTLAGCGGGDDTAEPDGDPAENGEEAGAPTGSAVSGDIMIYTSAEDAFISEVCAMFNEKYPMPTRNTTAPAPRRSSARSWPRR